MLMFGWDFEISAWSRFWRCLMKICVRICDMTSRRYFGKQNSTLGSVVPLAMFFKFVFSWLLQKRIKGSASESELHTSKEVGCPSTNGETITERQQWLWRTHYSRQNHYVTLSNGRHSVTWKKKRRDATFPEDILKTHLFTSQPTNCDSWTIEAKNISWPCCCGKSPRGTFYALQNFTALPPPWDCRPT